MKSPNRKIETWRSLLSYPFRHFGKLSFWNKAGFIGTVATVLGLVLTIIFPAWAYISERLDWGKSRPARAAVVREVAKAYSVLFYAAEDLMKPSSDSPSLETFLQAKKKFEHAEHCIQETQTLVIRNNRALDPVLISKVSEFISAANSVNKRLTYFAQMFDPNMSGYDFVSEGPFNQIAKMDEIINDLRNDYPDVLRLGEGIAGNLKSNQELNAIWQEADVRLKRLCLTPTKYVWATNMVPCVFNPANLAQLQVGPDGSTVFVMYGYQ